MKIAATFEWNSFFAANLLSMAKTANLNQAGKKSRKKLRKQGRVGKVPAVGPAAAASELILMRIVFCRPAFVCGSLTGFKHLLAQ